MSNKFKDILVKGKWKKGKKIPKKLAEKVSAKCAKTFSKLLKKRKRREEEAWRKFDKDTRYRDFRVRA